jgi:hypothetical protein
VLVKQSGVIPNIIKIDAEGYEVEIFKGGKETLSNPDIWIFLELHDIELAERGLLDSFCKYLLSLDRPVHRIDGNKATMDDLKKGGHYVIRARALKPIAARHGAA